MSDVLLLHAGVADRRMWEPQLDSLPQHGHRPLALDFPGFGDAPLAAGPLDLVAAAAERLERPAAVVGASLGARVALELALARPELVERLVLVGAPPTAPAEWTEATRALFAEEDAALGRGDLDGAAAQQARMWLGADAPEPVHDLVRRMTLRSYRLQLPFEHDVEWVWPDPPAGARLGEVTVPTLVVVGADDLPEIVAHAHELAARIPGAAAAVVDGAAHLPSLERPAAFDAAVLPFLAAA